MRSTRNCGSPVRKYGSYGRDAAPQEESRRKTTHGVVTLVSELVRILDGHNDTILDIHGYLRPGWKDTAGFKPRSFFQRNTTGHIDLPRARDGGLAGGFFAIWIPEDTASWRPALTDADTQVDSRERMTRVVDHGFALRLAMSLMGTLFRLEAAAAGQFKVVRDLVELEECLDSRTLAAILHFEGAEPVDPELNNLPVFYRAGLRSLGLVWSRPNAFGHGVPFRFPSTPDTGLGLTDAGKRLVRACNDMGILVDVSHLNERGFWDVAEVSTAPLVATHSNAHALSGASRNLLDSQLDAIRQSGGVVGVNFDVAFLRDDGRPNPDTPLDTVINHFAYLSDRMGVDHVAFGSDFDGAMIPLELGDVAGLQRLVGRLRERGFTTAEVDNLAHRNWLRVLGKTWKAPAPA